MVSYVAQSLEAFLDRAMLERHCPRFHLLGTSGTVTTVAGVYLNLSRYDRRRVDGLWMSAGDVSALQAADAVYDPALPPPASPPPPRPAGGTDV